MEWKSMELVSLQIIDDYVALIRFNRPEAKNAISRELLTQFAGCIKSVGKSKARVLVIQGSGDSFSAGADLKERSGWSESDVVAFLNEFRNCLIDLENLSIPSIALVNGFAFGGGLELALSCDLIYASENAIVGLTETKLGIIPGAGGTQRLAQRVGLQTAKEWIFRGKKLSSHEAYQKGLFLEIFPAESCELEVLKIAKDIAESAPIAVRAAKKAIKGSMSLEIESGLDWERICYFDTIRTKDRMEALLAFKEKRKPNFLGE